MDETKANQLAELLGADTWNSGMDMWLVVKRRNDGKLAVFSDESVCIYADEESLQTSEPLESLIFV